MSRVKTDMPPRRRRNRTSEGAQTAAGGVGSGAMVVSVKKPLPLI
jgi:hypothetical protein